MIPDEILYEDSYNLVLGLMARKNKKKLCATAPSEMLKKHLRALRLDTMEEYQVWCTENGFKVSVRKSEIQLRKEAEYFWDSVALEKLRKGKKETTVY